MIPDRERANQELEWAADLNPGPWKEHSRYVAAACESIASRCSRLDRDHAYVLGLLHDTGRYAGRTSERHLLDGYRRCMEHGWEEAARICISHAFMIQDINTSIGEFDVTPQDYAFMKEFISRAVYDDYDRLVQLCDSLALPTGFCPLETRFVDVTIRYGVHPCTIPRWKKVLEIKDYFEEQMGCTIYEALPCGGKLRHL
ncbi:MAG: HD domain-containing protein [Clostridia bacterium]|nr:HD domain-containing protein [Clostridia bacterium]